MGAARIGFAIKRNDESSRKEIFRGFAELLGLGVLMVAIDIGITIQREYARRNPIYEIV